MRFFIVKISNHFILFRFAWEISLCDEAQFEDRAKTIQYRKLHSKSAIIKSAKYVYCFQGYFLLITCFPCFAVSA